METADRLIKEGYREAGYEYVIIDDCWSEHERDSKGRLVADRKKFPHGMKYIADYLHNCGLKFRCRLLYLCRISGKLRS